MIHTTTLAVGGMSCDACVRHITRALDGMRGVVYVDVDLDRAVATVEHLPGQADAMALVAAVRDAGYPARIETVVPDDDVTVAGSQPATCANAAVDQFRRRGAAHRAYEGPVVG